MRQRLSGDLGQAGDSGGASRSDVLKAGLWVRAALKGHSASQPPSSATTTRAIAHGPMRTAAARYQVAWVRSAPVQFVAHMGSTRRRLAGLLGSAVLVMLGVGCAPQLSAPPRLIAAWPGRGARLPLAAQTFELAFNRPLSEAGSWAEISREEDGGGIAIENVVDRRDPRRMRIRLMNPEVGEFRLHWHAVGRRSTQAVEGEQEFALYNEAAEVPRLEVSRQAANVGDKVHLTGSGFAQGRTVRLTIGDDEQPLLTTDADPRGNFDVEARVPPTVAYGMQPVAAADRTGNVATAAVPVHWGGWPPLVAFAVGQAGPGRAR